MLLKGEAMGKTIIIGAGIAGSVMARELAEKGNREVVVLEQRSHIGGNCYDCKDKNGILIHQYGPHIFHTRKEEVYQYLSRFTKWLNFEHEVVARVGDQYLPIPFNFNTLYKVYGQEKAQILEKKLIECYGEGERISIMELQENKDQDIKALAQYVYENIFLHYTMKQWGQRPEEVSNEVTARVPVLTSYDNRYFQEPYQGMPLDGYQAMFEEILNHPNIHVKLEAKAEDYLAFKDDGIYYKGKLFTGEVIYTGALDELFHCEYGQLPYRTLDFRFEHYEKEDYQGYSVVNYTVSEDYTRITEFKHLTRQQDGQGTTIVKEYPLAYTAKLGEIPYYAILNDDNQKLYQRYLDRTKQYKNFYPIGRLAEYQYYNIDAMVEKALAVATAIVE